jgi:hypothetical protein
MSADGPLPRRSLPQGREATPPVPQGTGAQRRRGLT